MRKYLTILIVLIIGCQSKSVDKTENNPETSIKYVKSIELEKIEDSEQRFRDSLYTRESDNYISKIEEIPNRENNAYRITIKSKNGNWEKTEVIDTRPQMSRISYCNDLYTVVSFPCGGPCHSELFVFTKEDRPDEQYGYTQIVKNNPNIITYVRNEEFEKLIFHNFLNNKEMTVNNPESGLYNYGQMDSIIMKKENVILYYSTESEKHETKTINIRPIL